MPVNIMVIVVRIALALSLAYFAGSWMGLLTRELSSEKRFWIRIVGLLVFGAGLLLPAP